MEMEGGACYKIGRMIPSIATYGYDVQTINR